MSLPSKNNHDPAFPIDCTDGMSLLAYAALHVSVEEIMEEARMDQCMGSQYRDSGLSKLNAQGYVEYRVRYAKRLLDRLRREGI